MDNLSILPVKNGGKFRILQITDTHLFANQHEQLLGVNTWDSFTAVLDAIITGQHTYDIIVASGDLVQDQISEAYLHFVKGIARLNKPCFWLPGNHDFQPTMITTFAVTDICAEKQVLIGSEWQIILLDSQVSGVPHGILSNEQLVWLDNTLASQPHRYALVFLHHHPYPSGCTWLDQHSLHNASMLEAVLQKYPRVQTLVCGHIHQDLDLNWHGRRLLTTPSTCVQFRPHSARFTLDTLAPGWRWIDLYPQGRVESAVQRLKTRRFTPDMDAEGY
ncbi:3',5'-cyclic-AMP phosphodiesterase [Enterobacteriaceae bacterium LUAb1]